MALSGTVTSSGYEGRCVQLTWTATQDISANKSTISWTLKGAGNAAVSWYKAGGFYVNINGSVVCNWDPNNGPRIQLYNGTTVASGSVDIPHNSDGTKSFTISIQAGIYSYARNCSGSGTFSLNTIPRASTISVSGSFTMGSAKNISVSKANSNFTHTIEYVFGDASGTICTKSSATSISWTPPLSLANQITGSTSGWGSLVCRTYNGNTQVGTSTITFTCNVPSSIKPTVSATVTNSNNTFNCYAQNLSAVKVKPTASGSYGSTIKSINISVTGMTSKSASSGNTYTFDVFTSTGTKTITVTATDSRGRTASWSTSISVQAYSLPTANVTASRGDGSTVSSFVANDTGSYAKITATGSVSSISGNTITVSLQYKISTSSSWTTVSTSPSGLSLNSQSVIAANDTQAYNIRLTITDKAGKQAVSQMTLSNAFATIDFLVGGIGLAFGKTATRSGLDCAMILRMLPGKNNAQGLIAFYHNINSTETQVGSIYGSENGISIGSNNGKNIYINSAAALNISASSGINLQNDTSISKTLTVTGATSLKNTLAVTGAATLSSTLKVTGNSTLASTSISGTLLVNDGTLKIKSNVGTVYFGSSEKFNININGNATLSTIELYSTTPFVDFHFNNNTADYTTRIIESSSGTLEFRRWAGSSGAVCKSGGWETLSSQRIKSDIKQIAESEAEALLKLKPSTFVMKGNDHRSAGLIAEEVMDILPIVVTVPDGYDPGAKNLTIDKLPSIGYEQLIPYMIKLLQMQQNEICQLKANLVA